MIPQSFRFENNISCHAAEKNLVGEERGMIPLIDKYVIWKRDARGKS